MPIQLTEEQFAGRVIGYAQLVGWLVVHYRPALTARGWRTALQGDRGAPDLILARKGRVLLVELKSETGRMRPGQPEWAEQIGPELYRLWRPSDWPEIEKELR